MILVTGASGFIGQSLVARLKSGGMPVRAAVRGSSKSGHPGAETIEIGNIDGETGWGPSLSGISAIVHCAAKAKAPAGGTRDSLSEFRDINVHGALNLARQAAAAGVRRFVFVSSTRVLGDATETGRPFTPNDAPNPQDNYGLTKLEAEQGLREISGAAGMELVILRPPIVYGPGMKSALGAAARWMLKGAPLPLGAIDSPRSLIALDNLTDLLAMCAHHPKAAGETLLACDGEDLSVTGFLQRLSRAAGKPSRLLPVPPRVIQFCASAVGAKTFGERLCAPLQVDMSQTQRLLDWSPPLSVDAALKRLVSRP